MGYEARHSTKSNFQDLLKTMAFYNELWFWLFVVGLLIFIIGIIFYDYDRSRASNETPFWVWALLIFGVLLLIIAVILYALYFPSELEKCCGSWRYTKE
jgi:predicted membrane channel-forming protein YqfA (hemolysin III family)